MEEERGGGRSRSEVSFLVHSSGNDGCARARAVSEKTFLFERGGEGFIGECTSRQQNPMERGKTILPMKKRRKNFLRHCAIAKFAPKKNISPKIAGNYRIR